MQAALRPEDHQLLVEGHLRALLCQLQDLLPDLRQHLSFLLLGHLHVRYYLPEVRQLLREVQRLSDELH